MGFFKNLQIVEFVINYYCRVVLLYSSNVYVDNISAILFFLKSKLTASNKTCFSSKLNGEAIARALIVSSKLCFSNAFQLIINPLFSNNFFKSLNINSKSENFKFSFSLLRSFKYFLYLTSQVL